MLEEPFPQKVQFHNWGFILFLVCFFISAFTSNAGYKLLISMIKSLIENINRNSIFNEQVNNELVIKLLLCFQTILLLSIILFNGFLHNAELLNEADIQMFPFLGKASALIIVFLVYKSIVYNLVGNVFFSKDSIRQWNGYFMSLICISGFALFFPALLMFYFEKVYNLCCFFYLIYFIFTVILVFRKTYLLFFPHNALLLYFILYLCAQEIIPLYFLYKGLNYLFIIA
jgi:hypothetical protein